MSLTLKSINPFRIIGLFIRRIASCQIPLKYWGRVKFPHPVGIVIARYSKIGRRVVIYSNVTIGGKRRGTRREYPVIGKNVIIYTNSSIIGDIRIGDNAVIGAGSVVTKDVPAGEVWAGNPAKRIK